MAAAIVYWCVLCLLSPCVVLHRCPPICCPASESAPARRTAKCSTFPTLDALAALQTITKRRPQRGRAGAHVRHDAARRRAHQPHQGRPVAAGHRDPRPRPRQRLLAHRAPAYRAGDRRPSLDQRGTRRAPRFKMAGRVDVMIDGTHIGDLDFSTVGAQVMCSVALRPNQEVAIAWPGQHRVPREGGLDLVRDERRRRAAATARASISSTPTPRRWAPSCSTIRPEAATPCHRSPSPTPVSFTTR